MKDTSTSKQIVYTLHLTYKLDEDIQLLLRDMAVDVDERNHKDQYNLFSFINPFSFLSDAPYEIINNLSLSQLEKEINSYTQKFSDLFSDILAKKENYTAVIGLSINCENESKFSIFYNIYIRVMVLRNDELYREFVNIKPRKKDSLRDAQHFIFNTIKKITSERLVWLGYVILNYIKYNFNKNENEK